MRIRTSCTVLCGLALAAAGCGAPLSGGQKSPAAPRSAGAGEPADEPRPSKGKRQQIGRNVFLEIEGDKRRVLVEAEVCLRKGFLEHLLSRDQAEKFHESILSSEFDAQHIHVALLAAGAVPGWPIKYPRLRWPEERGMAPGGHAAAFAGTHQALGPFLMPLGLFTAGLEDVTIPQHGERIRVTLEYVQEGKRVRVAAQRWIRDFQSKKELNADWIFAGSQLYFDPEEPDRPPFYGANEGRVICVSNFSNALLDLAIKSEEGDPREGLQWEANDTLIPARETKVTVILEPMGRK